MAGTHLENGGLQNSLSGFTLGAEWLQEKVGLPRRNWMNNVNQGIKDMDIPCSHLLVVDVSGPGVDSMEATPTVQQSAATPGVQTLGAP